MLVPAILMLTVASIILVLGIIMLQNFRTLPLIQDLGSTVTNETTSFINGTIDTVNRVTAPGFHGFAVTEARQSTGVVIPAANYTINAATGTITNATATNYNVAHIDYTYLSGQDAYVTVNNTITGISSFSDFWSIIAIAIVAAIVLGIISALALRNSMK